MIIDAHSHVWDRLGGLHQGLPIKGEKWGRAYVGAELQPMLLPSYQDTISHPEIWLEYMDREAVDKTVFPMSAYYGMLNEYIGRVVRKWPDRFAGLGQIDYWLCQGLYDRAADEVERIVGDHSLVGVKFEASDQHQVVYAINPEFRFDSELMDQVWARLSELDLVACIHPAWGLRGRRQQQELSNVLARYPNIRIVVAHLGDTTGLPDPEHEITWLGWLEFVRKHDLAAFDAQPFSFSFIKRGLDPEYPFPRWQTEVFQRAVQTVGASKIMWALDGPWSLRLLTYRQALDVIRRHCNFLSSEEKALVLGENAKRFYRL